MGARQKLSSGPKQFSSASSPHLKCFFPQTAQHRGAGLRTRELVAFQDILFMQMKGLGRRGFAFYAFKEVSLYLHNFTRLHQRIL